MVKAQHPQLSHEIHGKGQIHDHEKIKLRKIKFHGLFFPSSVMPRRVILRTPSLSDLSLWVMCELSSNGQMVRIY